MAVYTPVHRADLVTYLSAYSLGALIDFRGIEQGVENTNYLIETGTGRYILTLFEKRVAPEDLPFFAAAMAHMSAHGVPAPMPAPDREGRFFSMLAGRPAAIFTFLEGRQRMAPTDSDCRAVGVVTARLHLAARDFIPKRTNALSLAGWRALAAKCGHRADEAAPGLCALIFDELGFLEAAWPKEAPSGLIHADLFPDNVFFDGDAVSGVIDFYFACTDLYIYDLALALNAWAAPGRPWSGDAARAFIEGYTSVRRLSDPEAAALQVCLRGASLRILLTRLHDWLHRAEGALVTVKDPIEYRDLLLFHRSGGSAGLVGP